MAAPQKAERKKPKLSNLKPQQKIEKKGKGKEKEKGKEKGKGKEKEKEKEKKMMMIQVNESPSGGGGGAKKKARNASLPSHPKTGMAKKTFLLKAKKGKGDGISQKRAHPSDAKSTFKKPRIVPNDAAPDKGTSRHLLKKSLKETRQKSANPNFELGKEVKELWEKLRSRNLEDAERSRITSTILQRMKGKIPAMATSHVVSRVLQTCLKYCNPEEKAAIHNELRPHFLNMAQNTYSHHLVTKMLDEAATDKKQLQKMLSTLHGHVVSFLRHPVASAVVEHAYQLASSAQKRELVAEFFSPEYRLFKDIISENSCRLSEALANESSSKRRSVLEHMALCLQPILEKGIVDHSIVHRALVEYLSVVNKATAVEVLQQLSGPLLVRFIHTKDGAKLGVTCVAVGSRKERKKIIKGLKGCATKVACDQYGCSVLMAILDLVDDTEIVNKFIMNELANNAKDIVFDRHGRRVFLHLLSPSNIQYVSPDFLTPIQIHKGASTEEDGIENAEHDVKEATDEDFDVKETEKDMGMNESEEQGKVVGNEVIQEDDAEEKVKSISKKDPFLRRTELLKSLAEKLVDVLVLHTRDLICSPLGKDLIYEVAKGGYQGVMIHVAPAGVSRVHQAIADLGAESRTVCAEGGLEHVFEQYHASRTIRKLITEPIASVDGVSIPSFARVLWKTALRGKCSEWATGHSMKVVSALQLCPDLKLRKEAMVELKPLLKAGLLQEVDTKINVRS